MRLFSIFATFCLVLSAHQIQAQHQPVISSPPPVYEGKDEARELMLQLNQKPRFKDYKPDFRAVKKTHTFQGPKGPYSLEITYIMDGEKYVGLFWNRPQVELLVSDPALAPTELKLPARYHNATFHGTRMTTIAWVDRWAVSGDEHGRMFEGGGDSITLREWQVYKKDGRLKVEGQSEQTYTFRVDPYMGYVIDVNCSFKMSDYPKHKGKTLKGFEFTNLLNGRMSNPWVGKSQYDRTVYTPSEKDKFGDHRYAGWANHVVANDRSDNGRRVEVRDGGFVSFLDKDDYSALLVRSGNVDFSLATCNVWQDQHQHVDMPKEKDNDGYYSMQWQARLQFVPPVVSNHIWKSMIVDDFDGARAVSIPLGVDVNFEDQPQPLTDARRGISNPFALHIAEGKGRGDGKALVFNPKDPHQRWRSKHEKKWARFGELNEDQLKKKEAEARTLFDKTAKKHAQDRGIFLFLPQIPLDPSTTYRIEAWVKTPAEGSFSITADLYEWTPHNWQRLKRQETQVLRTNGEWQKISYEFTTPNFDPFVDLRFRPRGQGPIYLDDFSFKAINAVNTQTD